MKGVVLTSTGEVLATPTPQEVANLFKNSPKVGLNFTKIFDFEDDDDDDESSQASSSTPVIDGGVNLPPSPSSRKEKERNKTKSRQRGASTDTELAVSSVTVQSSNASNFLPTRLRRPSIRSRPQVQRSATLPSSTSDPSSLSSASGSASTSQIVPKPLSHPHLANPTGRTAVTKQQPDYDLADEENLPSPFLKRNLDRPTTRQPVQQVKKRPSTGHGLRAVAAANAAIKRVSSLFSEDTPTESSDTITRSALASARRAGEEARKTLLRP